MVHAALHWPNDGADDIRLWAFAVSHAAWLYNRLPNKNLGWMSTLEIFTKTKSDHRDLLRTHVWGCPVFVLEPRLQDGKKIPKFKKRARMGQFLGFSDEHSSLVARVRNLGTNFVSPQFHVVFDDMFSTIHNDVQMKDTAVQGIFEDLFETCTDYYGEEIETPEGADAESDPPLELGGEWLTEPERREKKARQEEWRARQHKIRQNQAKEFEQLNADYNPPLPISIDHDDDPPPDSSAISDDDNSSVDSDLSEPWTGNAPEGAAFEDDEAPPLDHTGPSNPPRCSKRSRGEYNPKTAGLHDGIRDGAYYKRLDKHPDYERCYHKSLVTDRMRNEGFIKANKQRFCCTLGTK